MAASRGVQRPRSRASHNAAVTMTEPFTNRCRRPQSPVLRVREENDSIGLDNEAEHRMAVVAFRVHQHRLAQPPPDLAAWEQDIATRPDAQARDSASVGRDSTTSARGADARS